MTTQPPKGYVNSIFLDSTVRFLIWVTSDDGRWHVCKLSEDTDLAYEDLYVPDYENDQVWVHPRLAVLYSIHRDADFAAQVCDWIAEIIASESVHTGSKFVTVQYDEDAIPRVIRPLFNA